MTLEQKLYEAQQRIHWFIDGIGIHGLSTEVFSYLSTERLCELYNVEIEHFRPHLKK